MNEITILIAVAVVLLLLAIASRVMDILIGILGTAGGILLYGWLGTTESLSTQLEFAHKYNLNPSDFKTYAIALIAVSVVLFIIGLARGKKREKIVVVQQQQQQTPVQATQPASAPVAEPVEAPTQAEPILNPQPQVETPKVEENNIDAMVIEAKPKEIKQEAELKVKVKDEPEIVEKEETPKKTTTRRTTTSRRATAKKPAAKKTTTSKSTTAKKPAAKKTTTKSTTAKKPTTKKTTTKSTTK